MDDSRVGEEISDQFLRSVLNAMPFRVSRSLVEQELRVSSKASVLFLVYDNRPREDKDLFVEALKTISWEGRVVWFRHLGSLGQVAESIRETAPDGIVLIDPPGDSAFELVALLNATAALSLVLFHDQPAEDLVEAITSGEVGFHILKGWDIGIVIVEDFLFRLDKMNRYS